MYYFRVDANKSGTITPEELQAALVNGNGTEFNMTTINMMIGETRSKQILTISFLQGMFDRDKSGEITFDEFGSLYRYIVDWQNCFKKFDRFRENYYKE